MNYTAYGVRISSPKAFPLKLPDDGDTDEVVELIFHSDTAAHPIKLPYHALTVNMHERDVTLASSHPMNTDRKAPQRQWELIIGELFSLKWKNSSNSIEISCAQQPDMDLLVFWLLHTAIPVYLMLRETNLFLHASSVAIDGEAVLFTAPSFGGKSTMVDYFARQGFDLITDDKARLTAISDDYHVFSSHPYRRPNREYEALGEYSENFRNTSLPLNSIFALNLVDANSECRVTKLAGLEKFELVKSSSLYGAISLTEPVIKEILSMVLHCEVYRIDVPRDLCRLPEVCELILRHIKKSA